MRTLGPWKLQCYIRVQWKEIYTGWPRKNATLSCINNFKKTRDRMKKLCALLHIKFFFHCKMTPRSLILMKAILILWPFFWGNVIFKICRFYLKSHNLRKWKFSIVWLPRVKCLLLLCKAKPYMNKEKNSLRNFAVLEFGGATQRNSSWPQMWLSDTKGANFENDIASEKWL